MAGVNVQTLRYYERRGLLPEPERLESGYRSYGPEAVRIVRFVKRAQRLGFSLEEVESLLQLAAGGPRSCADARQVAAEKLVDLQRRIEALEAMRRSLAQLVATCERPRSRRECPLLEALADGDDVDGSETTEDTTEDKEPGFIGRFDGFELLPHVVRLLARGQPVAPGQVAEAAGLSVAQVEGFLQAQSGTDWEDDGRVAGFGLTLRPTPHRFVVDGQVLYTWCATDTLVFPAILGRGAMVESTCPATARSIRLDVMPEAVVFVEPPTTVVSRVHPAEAVDDIRGLVCCHGHFFSSPQSASDWAAGHPEGQVLSVSEAFAHARAACEGLGWAQSASGAEA
jgi:alkylmercury lyase